MLRLLNLLLLLFVSCATWADQLIIEPDMGRKPIIDAIACAQQSVKLTMYGMTDKEILNAILQQKIRGKTIQVILEQSPYKTENENGNAIQALNANNIDWRGSIPNMRLIHQKTLLIDGREAIVMTFNFTRSTFNKERNFALIIDDPARVQGINTVFSADWSQKPVVNANPDLIYSPDDSREKLSTLINHAKKSIKIYAQNISDYKIIGMLAKAARSGVDVQIISSEKMRERQADYLQRAGVIVHKNDQYIIHAKVFIIDDELAVLGSINLTKASLDSNRELSVITRDRSVIKALDDVFVKDWGDTTTLTLGKQKLKLNFNEKDAKQAVRLLKKLAHKYLDN